MTPRPVDSQNAPEAGSTRTVDRAFDLLSAVTDNARGDVRGGTTLSELARATELSPATASRLLATLLKRGLVRRDAQGLYRPGLALMQMAAGVLRGEPLYELAGGHLVELAAASGETANLGVAVDDDRALYLRQVAGDQRVQTATWRRYRAPAISACRPRPGRGARSRVRAPRWAPHWPVVFRLTGTRSAVGRSNPT
jgi:DNA-binding IclR family transcriptional regulator